MADGIHTLAKGHTNLKQLIKKWVTMRYKILVDSVVLANKPLSNLEIINAAKVLSLYGFFRVVFLRDIVPTNTKLKECGILNLDLSSGDGTHWVMWFKKGKENFYFDSYGVHPPSELIAYLKSQIFFNSKRVQQNGEVFCGHLCLFALKQLSLGNNLQALLNYLI